MEDRLSITSADSIISSEEFEIVPEKPISSPNLPITPTLNIAHGNLDDLKQTLTEVLHEPDVNTDKQIQSTSPSIHVTGSGSTMESENIMRIDTARKVGQSTFYDKDEVDSSVTTEKADDMKPETDDDGIYILYYNFIHIHYIFKGFFVIDSLAVSDIDQDCTVFNGVTYLGAANINAPRSEAEIHRNMSVLNSAPGGLKVSVSVPICSEGVVV